MTKKSLIHLIKDRFSLKYLISSILLVGFLFFVFAWVPYKREERQLKFLEQYTVQMQGGLQEFGGLLGIVAREPSSLNQAGIAYHLRNQTEASSRMLEMIDGIPSAIIEESKMIDDLPALIFYPSFSEKIQDTLAFEIPANEEKIKDLKLILQTHKEVNQALLNLIAFDPNVFFDKPFSSYDKKELIKKLNSLNESIGKTELSLSSINSSLDIRVDKVLTLVKSEHQKIISMIDAVNKNDYREADRLNNELTSSLTITRESLDDRNLYLLKIDIDEKYFQMIDEILELQGNLLQNINQIQEEYF